MPSSATPFTQLVKSERPNYFIGTDDGPLGGRTLCGDEGATDLSSHGEGKQLNQTTNKTTILPTSNQMMGSNHPVPPTAIQPPNSLFDPYPIMALNDPDAPSDTDSKVGIFTESHSGADLLSPLAHRVDSAEITFQKKRLKPKFIPSKYASGQDEERYLLGDVLGEGCYSKVKEVMDMRSLRRMAVKIMTRKRLRKIANGEENCQREMSLLRKLSTHRHENVIHMYDLIVDQESGKFYVLLEYCAIVLQELIDSAPHKRLPTFQAHS